MVVGVGLWDWDWHDPSILRGTGAAQGMSPPAMPAPTLTCFPDCEKHRRSAIKIAPLISGPTVQMITILTFVPPVRITWTPWLELRQNSHISAFDILTPSLPIGIPQYAYFHLDFLDRFLASEDTTIPYDLEVAVFIDLLSAGSSLGGGTTRSCHGTIGELGPAAVLKAFPWNDALVVLTYGTNRTSISVCVVPDSQWKSQYKYYVHRNDVPKI